MTFITPERELPSIDQLCRVFRRRLLHYGAFSREVKDELTRLEAMTDEMMQERTGRYKRLEKTASAELLNALRQSAIHAADIYLAVEMLRRQVELMTPETDQPM